MVSTLFPFLLISPHLHTSPVVFSYPTFSSPYARINPIPAPPPLILIRYKPRALADAPSLANRPATTLSACSSAILATPSTYCKTCCEIRFKLCSPIYLAMLAGFSSIDMKKCRSIPRASLNELDAKIKFLASSVRRGVGRLPLTTRVLGLWTSLRNAVILLRRCGRMARCAPSHSFSPNYSSQDAKKDVR